MFTQSAFFFFFFVSQRYIPQRYVPQRYNYAAHGRHFIIKQNKKWMLLFIAHGLLGFCLDALAFKKVPVVRIVRSTLEIHSFPCSCLVPVVHYCCQGQPKKTYRTRKRGLQCCCLKSNVEQRCSKGTCKQTYCARMCHTWCARANGLLVVYYISLVVGGLVTRERTSS